jgi:hypothetical protein
VVARPAPRARLPARGIDHGPGGLAAGAVTDSARFVSFFDGSVDGYFKGESYDVRAVRSDL